MSPDHDHLNFLTLSEVARILQVSKRTLLRMLHERKLPALKVGGQWRIRESQLRQWIERQEKWA